MVPAVSTVLTGVFGQSTAWDELGDVVPYPRLQVEVKDRTTGFYRSPQPVPFLAVVGGNSSKIHKKSVQTDWPKRSYLSLF